MAEIALLKVILLIGILSAQLSEVSGIFFYTKLTVTSLTYKDSLRTKDGADFKEVATELQDLIRASLIAGASNTVLTAETVQSVTVQQFSSVSTGTVAIILVSVKDHNEAETSFSDTLKKEIEDGKIGEKTVDKTSLDIITRQDQCEDGYVIDFGSRDCQPCPIGTYQKVKIQGQCDACPVGKSTFSNATVGAVECKSHCVLDPMYCNTGQCEYTFPAGVKCTCKGDVFGGSRCEKLIVFYISFDLKDHTFQESLKNKSSPEYTSLTVNLRYLVRDTLTSSNNALLENEKIHEVHVLTYNPGNNGALNAAVRVKVVNGTDVEDVFPRVMNDAVLSGKLGDKSVDSLILINNIIPCTMGYVMDFTTKSCTECPIHTFEDLSDPGQCEDCPYGTLTLSAGKYQVNRFSTPCLDFCIVRLDHCLNGGTCAFKKTGDDKGPHCTCPFDYGGTNCEILMTLAHTVQPTYGPEAGGTLITVIGHHFNESREMNITIGESECEYIEGNATVITCKTGEFNRSAYSYGQKLNVVVSYGLPPARFVTDGLFAYRRNPKIEEISPEAIYRNGGLGLTVTGRYMDGVFEPKMMLTVPKGDKEEVIESKCIVEDKFTLVCPTPKIPFNGDNPEKSENVKLGFLFDGLKRYHDLKEDIPSFASITVHPDPVIEPFDHGFRLFNPEKEKRLTLKGKRLSAQGALSKYYTIYIGDNICRDLQMKSTEISCEMPDRPSKYSVYKVKVEISGLEFSPGSLKYESGYWEDDVTKFIIVGSAIGGGALIFSAVSAWILLSTTVCIRPSTRAKDSQGSSLVGDHISEDAESIIPNPMEGYHQQPLPDFSNARFYTSGSRGRAYENPTIGLSMEDSGETNTETEEPSGPSTARSIGQSSGRSIGQSSRRSGASSGARSFLSRVGRGTGRSRGGGTGRSRGRFAAWGNSRRSANSNSQTFMY